MSTPPVRDLTTPEGAATELAELLFYTVTLETLDRGRVRCKIAPMHLGEGDTHHTQDYTVPWRAWDAACTHLALIAYEMHTDAFRLAYGARQGEEAVRAAEERVVRLRESLVAAEAQAKLIREDSSGATANFHRLDATARDIATLALRVRKGDGE